MILSRPQFLNALVPIADHGYEQIYTITIPNTDAFQLINTAVFYTLARLAPGDDATGNGVDGGQCYDIRSGGIWVQLFVLRLSAHTAIVRMFPLYPTDPIEGILWLHGNHLEAAHIAASV